MNDIVITQQTAIVPLATVAELGQAANKAAKDNAFERGLSGKTENTRTSYQTDLATWAQYLADAGGDIKGCDFYTDPACWSGVTHGLVDAFIEWMKRQGYAISSINRKLSCVRVFCGMAGKAGVIPGDALAMIQTVGTIRRGQGMEVDKQRTNTRVARPQAKKAKSINLTAEQAKALKAQPNTPQGRRDALLMCLLLDHGLRSGELAALAVSNIDMKTGIMTFWREKVKKEQKHKLTADTLTALHNYIESGDCAGIGPLLRSSVNGGRKRKDGTDNEGKSKLGKSGMAEHAITVRVKVLGKAIGVDGLSAHDCRHYWATSAVKGKTDPFALLQAGGWSSMQTVQRYVSENEIANDGVKLGE